ncbi:MAG: PEGA domain-containing protein [Myxococcales bacterium]|nr:PEGA domain-containing protein [Myxococcales bacterium]MCB9628319.1 PEGA domain-containing protein [Sandaracinaceae bacterium]
MALLSAVLLAATAGEARAQVAQLVLAPQNPPAQGAAVRVDGADVGNLPLTLEVTPGRHLVQVGRRGYITFNLWIDVTPGQTMQLPVTLRGTAGEMGSILVAGDVSGARVLVDSVERGTSPVVVEGLSVGSHRVRVEARDGGLAPFETTVEVRVAERTTVHFTMRPTHTPGSLHVAANVLSARLFLDGDPLGVGGRTVEGLAPGEHIVEAEANGYQTARQTVRVESGRRSAVVLVMEPVAQEPGTIVVRANVRGQVFVNGQDFGPAPVILEGAEPGSYAIRVTADGHSEFRDVCQVRLGETCTITATLVPEQVLLRVTSSTRGAFLYVDGEYRGPVPFEGLFPVGPHRVEVRAQNYATHTEQVSLSAGGPRDVAVDLQRVGAETPEEIAEAEVAAVETTRSLRSYAATLTPERRSYFDVAIGFPYILEARVGGNVHEWLDIGFSLRSFFGLTEFDGRLKTAYRALPSLSLGAQLRIGGGFGPTHMYRDGAIPRESPTNTFLFSLEGLVSVHFAAAASVTAIVAFDTHSDRYRGPNRRGAARLRLGGVAEIVVSDSWNVMLRFEGIVAGRSRPIMTDLVGAGLIDSDPRLLGQLGFTYKFGLPSWDSE